MYNPFSLEGKNVLVTGASSGIGQTTAIEASKLGATMFVTGRDVERLAETLGMLDTSFGQKHSSFVVDFASEDQIISLVESMPVLDGLVNNAGANKVKPVLFIKQEDIDDVFQINSFSSVLLTGQLVKKKKIAKGGSIVFTSSVSSFYNAPGRALYAASKSALTAFMRSFAVELSDKGIRANAVHPGMVETKMIKENLTEDERTVAMQEYPLKRFGKPEDIAWAIIYLLSDASSWVTGTSLVIDGGFMIK